MFVTDGGRGGEGDDVNCWERYWWWVGFVPCFGDCMEVGWFIVGVVG